MKLTNWLFHYFAYLYSYNSTLQHLCDCQNHWNLWTFNTAESNREEINIIQISKQNQFNYNFLKIDISQHLDFINLLNIAWLWNKTISLAENLQASHGKFPLDLNWTYAASRGSFSKHQINYCIVNENMFFSITGWPAKNYFFHKIMFDKYWL